jgi:hypothetical protein
LKENPDLLRVNLSERRLKRLNPGADLTVLQTLSLEAEDFDRVADLVSEKIAEITPRLIDDAAAAILKGFRKTRREQLASTRTYREGFETRIEKRWRKGVDALEQLIGGCCRSRASGQR